MFITVIETWEKCWYTYRILKFGNWIFFRLPSQHLRIERFKEHNNLNHNVPPEEARYHQFLWLVDFTDMLELYDINPVFSYYISKLSSFYLFLNFPHVKLF